MLVMSSTAVVCSQQARCCIVRSDLLLRQPTPSVNGVLVHEALASNLQPSTPAYIVMNPRVLVCKGSQSRSRRAHVAGLERHVLDRKAEGRYGIKSQKSVGCAIASVVRQLLRPQASQGDTKSTVRERIHRRHCIPSDRVDMEDLQGRRARNDRRYCRDEP